MSALMLLAQCGGEHTRHLPLTTRVPAPEIAFKGKVGSCLPVPKLIYTPPSNLRSNQGHTDTRSEIEIRSQFSPRSNLTTSKDS